MVSNMSYFPLFRVTIVKQAEYTTFYRELMNNRVFFQHPDLIGMLIIHENVMTVMMNTIGKSQNLPENEAGPTDAKQVCPDSTLLVST